MAGAKKHSKNNAKKLVAFVVSVIFLIILAWFLSGTNIPVLQPAGQIGVKERQLIVWAILLSVIVVVPVFAMTIFIVLKYRDGNENAKRYSPEWDHSRFLEFLWWGIPAVIITVLSVITWNSSHQLDPYRAVDASKKTLNVEVVAMNWKWLFIYPEQNIASVNLLEMPLGTPVDFHITSDTVMNSFWIPQLGGQIYAMPGMSTQLHLVADKAGNYYGSPANISGSGFSRMTFDAKGVSLAEFNSWINNAKHSRARLNSKTYASLSQPSDNDPVSYYSDVPVGFYNALVMKYMEPTNGTTINPSSNEMIMPGMRT